MRSRSRPGLPGAWRFVSLIVLGLTVLAGWILLRVADRPQTVQPMTERDLRYRTFSIGIGPGTFTNLVAKNAPTLTLTSGPGDGTIRARFTVGLYGKGGEGKLVVDAPEADNFVLEQPTPEHFDFEEPPKRSHQTLSLSKDSSAPGPPGGDTVLTSTSAEVSFSGHPWQYIALGWVWRPSESLSRSGLGRKNITIVFKFQRHADTLFDSHHRYIGGDGIPTQPLTADPGVGSSEDESLDETLQHLVVSYTAGSGERMTAETLGAVYPEPNVVQWTHEDHHKPTYYRLSVEDQRIRLWVGLLTELTLFVAGILLGGAAGAMAAKWYTIRSATNAKS